MDNSNYVPSSKLEQRLLDAYSAYMPGIPNIRTFLDDLLQYRDAVIYETREANKIRVPLQ